MLIGLHQARMWRHIGVGLYSEAVSTSGNSAFLGALAHLVGATEVIVMGENDFLSPIQRFQHSQGR